MEKKSPLNLSRRERQIMEILFRKKEGSVSDVLEEMPDAPGYSAVRAMLRMLEEKGHLKHKKEGKKFIFLPTAKKENVRKSAMQNLLSTFFDGSVEDAVASLLDMNSEKLTENDFERLSTLIDKARKEEE